MTTVPRQRHINALKFLGPTTILYGGGNQFNASLQELWISGNLGMVWEIVNNNLGQAWIKSLAFTDTLQGFAVGDSATIMKTVNGGRYWTVLPKPIQNREFNRIIYKTPSTLFIVGGSLPQTDTIQCILKSTDTGNTWNVIIDRDGHWLHDISFADSLNGVTVGDNGTILRTADGGMTWDTITAPVIRHFRAVEFISPSIGYIAGGNDLPDSKRTILRTGNGGESWDILVDETGGMLKDIDFLNTTTGYIVGDSATVLKTTNGGLNWIKDTVSQAAPDQVFNCVEFRNEELGMIGANGGFLYVYLPSQPAVTYTLNARFVDSIRVEFTGGIDTHGELCTYNIVYSTDSTMQSFAEAFYLPENVRHYSLQPVSYTMTDSSLIPDTIYYYFYKTWAHAGWTYGDTLSFRTSPKTYTFETLPATQVGSTSASLNGKLEKFPRDIQLFFEYGKSLEFDSLVSAVPPSVSDTMLYLVYAGLSELDSNMIYYFRMTGLSGPEKIYGAVQTFFTGKVFETLNTLPATTIYDSTVTLNGFIDKFRLPAEIGFEYGTNPSLGYYAPAMPSPIMDTGSYSVSTSLNSLIPNTLYYYRIKAQTPIAPFYGDILTFRSGLSYTFLNTTDATRVTSSSAQLNALARNLSSSVSLSFEYGTTPDMENIVTANPAIISDTGTYAISASLAGLNPNQFYYFRLKSVSGSITTYGDTRQFYTGGSEIPNWDFQIWEIDTLSIPAGWNIYMKEFERVPGHTGNYALKLYNRGMAGNALIGDKFFGGVGMNFSSPPDSIVAFMKYQVEPGDTAGMMTILYKGKREIGVTYMFATGNSNGQFIRKAVPLHYDSLVVPDTAVMLIVSSVYEITNDPDSSGSNNSLEIDDISFLPGPVEFENSDFEHWFSSYIEIPVGWFSFYYTALDSTDPNKNHMISRVYFEEPDDYAVSVNNVELPSIGPTTGILSTIKDLFSNNHSKGFPVRGKYQTLNGYYQYFPGSQDSMRIIVTMTKNQVEIGRGLFQSGVSVPAFTPFSIPILYTIDSIIPDTAIIDISSSTRQNPTLSSRLIIDKLSFDGFVETDLPTRTEVFVTEELIIYPNPARDLINIENTAAYQKAGTVSVISLNGRLIRNVPLPPGRSTVQLPTGDLSPGMYILMIQSGDKILSKKIIIQ